MKIKQIKYNKINIHYFTCNTTDGCPNLFKKWYPLKYKWTIPNSRQGLVHYENSDCTG